MWERLRDALQRQTAKAEAEGRARKGEAVQRSHPWDSFREAMHGGPGAEERKQRWAEERADKRPEAEKAWDRGDAVYVHRTSQSIANYKFEQRIINAEVNAITAVGWELSATSTKLGAIIFTFVRPSGPDVRSDERGASN